MYTPIQLEAIRVFGKKDLTFGCVLELKEKEDGDVNYFYVCKSDFDGDTVFAKTKEKGYEDCTLEFDRSEYEILGHEPELCPDLARAAQERGWLLSVKWGLLTITFPDRTFTCCEYFMNLTFIEQPERILKQLISLFTQAGHAK